MVVRPFNVYGPGQVGTGALRTFILRHWPTRPSRSTATGPRSGQWCYVDDMVDGVLLGLVHDKAVGESFNIGNARTVVTITGLANAVVRVLESRSEIIYTRKDYADVELRVPSVRKARELLGFEAKIDLEEGIRRSAEWYRKQ